MKKRVTNTIIRYMQEYLSEQDASAMEAWKEVESAVMDSVKGLIIDDDGMVREESSKGISASK
jgi:hypothetical protein